MTPTMTNRAVSIYDPADMRKLNKMAHGPTWAIHTMTGSGSLILDDPDETTRFLYGSSTAHQGLTVNKQQRPVLSATIVSTPTRHSATARTRKHSAAVSLASLRSLNERLEIVQNEIHCLDDESSLHTDQR